MPLGNTIDYSPEELDRIRRRQEIRRNLKAEFNRQAYNPYRQVYRVELHDPAVERAMAARAHRYEFAKPTWRGFLVYVGTTFVPMIVAAYYFKGQRDHNEHMMRTGQWTYAMQENKSLRVPSNVHQML